MSDTVKSSRPLRAGLWGAGAFGRFLLESVAQSPLLQVTAIASKTWSTANDVAQQFGIAKVYQNYEELLADTELDLIAIVTEPSNHGPAALAALNAGKHVFVEKPLATNLEVAERIIALAANRNRQVALDYPMLYSPLIEGLGLFRTSGLAGSLVRIAVDNIASCEGLGDDHWFWDKEHSGGIFIEHGVHFFDWCSRLAETPASVVALSYRHGKREDRVFAAVEHSGGVLASYYHAFIASKQMERTRAVISFESVDAVLDGWIPLELRFTGPLAGVSTTVMRRMLHRSVESVATSEGFLFRAGAKQDVYARAVRAGMEDLARAIGERGYSPRNSANKSLLSLRLAVAATQAAEARCVQQLWPTKTPVIP